LEHALFTSIRGRELIKQVSIFDGSFLLDANFFFVFFQIRRGLNDQMKQQMLLHLQNGSTELHNG